MVRDVETYLQELKTALISTGADPALVQDALFDAEEYLQAEMAAREQLQSGDGRSLTETEREAGFAAVVEGYGTPAEVAAAYVGATSLAGSQTMDTPDAVAPPTPFEAEEPALEPQATSAPEPTPEPTPQQSGPRCPACAADVAPDQVFCTRCGTRLQSRPVAPPPPPPRAAMTAEPLPAGVEQGMQAAASTGAGEQSVWRQIFGPFADGRVWTSLVYMFLSLATGIAYFTIVVTGFSTAGGMLVLIIGIPLFMLVLAVVRGLALFEGRLVEALLGTRMPRRSRPTPPDLGFLQRMLFWLKDGRTWASIAYMVLMLPLGTIYFTIAVVGLSVGIALVTAPVWVLAGLGTGDHTWIINGVAHHEYWPLWGTPIAFVVGVLLLIGFMHLVKWIGRGHAAFAKAMLVRL